MLCLQRGCARLSGARVAARKGTPYAELDLGNSKWSDDELIDVMLAHPILNRPIVVTPMVHETVDVVMQA